MLACLLSVEKLGRGTQKCSQAPRKPLRWRALQQWPTAFLQPKCLRRSWSRFRRFLQLVIDHMPAYLRCF